MGNSVSNSRGAGGGWWSSSSNGHVPVNRDPHPIMEELHRPSREGLDEDNEGATGGSDSDIEEDDRPAAPRVLSPAKAKEMEEFRKQLAVKREARKQIIAEKTGEMMSLREQLEAERRLRVEAMNENTALRALIAQNNISVPGANVSEQEVDGETSGASASELEEIEKQFSLLKDQSKTIKAELAATNYALQSVNTETELLNKENFELKNQIRSLKEVNTVSKQMLTIRESQLTQLKDKLSDIEKSLADREMKTLSSDLRSEYERQLENIRNLRILYEERARVAEVTRHNLVRDLEDQKVQTEMQITKCGELQGKIDELEKNVSDKDDSLISKESQLGVSRAETKGLQAEMTVINQLFSQMLLGYNNTQDLDKLLLKLEENHDLLTDMVVREDSSEVASALPKLILDLVKQIDASEPPPSDTKSSDSEPAITEDAVPGPSKPIVTSANEIVGNLPKVWRVLMELLSHQSGPPLVIADISEKSSNSCYNSVDTPSGPRLVPSVSKTYIRLKDLILEKKSLQKEMIRLKQLNSHLESRHQDQERRLSLVSSELGKTWHIVGRMERQHQQLHTHEKILRYELHEKRVMLNELKEELEFCKDKWDRAKQKNSESQLEWDKLRLEFASRKVKSSDSINNSGESGYSDEKASDDDSESEKKLERKRLKRKASTPEVKTIETNEPKHQLDELDRLHDDDNEGSNGVDTSEEDQANLADIEDQSISEIDSSAQLNAEETDVEQDTAAASTASSQGTNYEDVLASRNARLKKLEEQCYVLVHKVSKNSKKGIQLCNRLEKLHNHYGNGDPAQPSTSQQSETSQLQEEETKKTEDKAFTPSTRVVNEDAEGRLRLSESSDDAVEEKTENDGIPKEFETPKNEDTERVVDAGESETSLNETEKIKDISPGTAAEPVVEDQPPFAFSTVSDYEARFLARDARLKRMEEQAKSLVKKVSNTSTRSLDICSKLDELHSTYGQDEEVEGSVDGASGGASTSIEPTQPQSKEQSEKDKVIKEDEVKEL